MPRSSSSRPTSRSAAAGSERSRAAAPARAAKPSQPPAPVRAPAPPPPPPPRRFLVRCSFVGEDKKVAVEGSFRFLADAADVAALLPKLEKGVNKLRRSGELPPRCEVFVEFIVELTELDRGVAADFERWERSPRKFQHGCITVSEHCAVYDQALPTFRFGKVAGPAAP